MSRSTDEWVGKTDDSAIPVRVKLRIWEKSGGCCQQCGARLYPGHFQFDHVTALINGGQHREENLQTLCDGCHRPKSRVDVAIKAKTQRSKSSHLGLKKPKGRPMAGSKASGWKRKMDGTVVKR